MHANIIIGGDVCPTGKNQSFFESGDAHTLLNDLLYEFQNADLSIVNLECPLIQTKAPIQKCGPVLGVSNECINGLKAMGVDVAGLANNHIMDHGDRGLRSTISALKDKGIDYVGAGESLEMARNILIRDVKGFRIGILAIAENEFGIATIDKPGSNPLNIMDTVRNITKHRDYFDYLIVLVHAGTELYPYPSPYLMDTCRFLVEQGANAVICQHSHCSGCVETYKEAPIVYGQGNFIFDYPTDAIEWREGLLVCLNINGKGTFELRFIPYRQSDGQPGVRKMNSDEEKMFMSGFYSRSTAIRDELFVAKQWEFYCKQNKRYYLNGLHGKPGFLRRLAGKLNKLHYLDSEEVQRNRLHFVRCESLREALITALRIETERKRYSRRLK